MLYELPNANTDQLFTWYADLYSYQAKLLDMEKPVHR